MANLNASTSSQCWNSVTSCVEDIRQKARSRIWKRGKAEGGGLTYMSPEDIQRLVSQSVPSSMQK